MAWNEPGNDDKDPWGAGNKNKGKNDGPPDLDEIFKNLFGKFFGGGNGGSGSRKGGGGDGLSASLLIGLILAAVLGIYVFKGFGVVNEQEKAVILRFGKFSDTRDAGLRWNPPLIDQVFTVNVTQVRTWTTDQTMLTKDLNIVDIRLSVQYSIDEAKDFVLNVRSPEVSLHQAASSALRHVVGLTEMHEVLTEGRAAMGIEVQARLQEYLGSYGTGIRVEKVNIEDTNPPDAVQDAFDDVIKAREDEERYQSEAEAYANDTIPRARGKAQRMIAESQAYNEDVIARAKGEAERFKLLLTEYRKAPEVTRQRLYLNTIQSVLSNSSKVIIDVEGGNNMMYLPLDKLPMNSATGGGTLPKTSASMDELAARIAEKMRGTTKTTDSSRRGGR